ncbi:CHASE3 domain-containing protein [Variovorax sp. HJSM1_2]|uniref:sensor histidine kinase n=1 Tax=Variovorax sp. HJSM1_2 TaxID=3366263 RepID=UPI003BE9B72F
MKRLSIPKMAISLPLAILAAVLLVGINETGYVRSVAALKNITEAQQNANQLSKLLQLMVDAETGQRGYLLTGDAGYLKPYERATGELQKNLETLQSFYTAHSQDLPSFTQLSRSVQGKLSEMDVSVRLRMQGNDDAWKFVLTTDVGREQMDAIRNQSLAMIERTQSAVASGQHQINRSLLLSRIGIALVALVGLLAFYMYLRQTRVVHELNLREQENLQKERDQLGQLVKDRTASLAELATHLQTVREQERGHLARELHDELGALLTAAKLDVARLKSKLAPAAPEIVERLQHLSESLNSVIALKRRIIEDLRPSALFNLGLLASLDILTREFSERSAIPVAVNFEPVELEDGIELIIYRLVQESLTNIYKYAQATEIEVSLTVKGAKLRVCVYDNGVGFNTKLTSSGHGLAGMRHRVEAVGGTLDIESPPSSGTRKGTLVLAVLPVLKPTPAVDSPTEG